MSRLQEFEVLAERLLQALETAKEIDDDQLVVIIESALFVTGKRISRLVLPDAGDGDRNLH